MVVAAVVEVVVVAAGDEAPALRTMGYDLRITRALDWGANKGREISAEEWLAVVKDDDDLEADPASGPFAVRYGDNRWFDWYEGNVFTTDPDHATVVKMFGIAERLSGAIQGDGGEFYDSASGWSRGAARGRQQPNRPR